MISIEVFLFGLASALIGYLVGNWLTIGRDRRKEFNDLVAPMRKSLLYIRDNPISASLTRDSMITFTLIREKLPYWKRSGFDKAIDNYKQSKNISNRKSDGMGGFLNADKSAIIHAVDDLLKYLKPR